MPVKCQFVDGMPIALKSPEYDDLLLFDNFKDLKFQIRRQDNNGNERQHDARICASRVFDNGNADLRIEFSDLYMSLNDICIACAFISQKRDGLPVSCTDNEVIAYAVANLT